MPHVPPYDAKVSSESISATLLSSVERRPLPLATIGDFRAIFPHVEEFPRRSQCGSQRFPDRNGRRMLAANLARKGHRSGKQDQPCDDVFAGSARPRISPRQRLPRPSADRYFRKLSPNPSAVLGALLPTRAFSGRRFGQYRWLVDRYGIVASRPRFFRVHQSADVGIARSPRLLDRLPMTKSGSVAAGDELGGALWNSSLMFEARPRSLRHCAADADAALILSVQLGRRRARRAGPWLRLWPPGYGARTVEAPSAPISGPAFQPKESRVDSREGLRSFVSICPQPAAALRRG